MFFKTIIVLSLAAFALATPVAQVEAREELAKKVSSTKANTHFFFTKPD